ncbi:hypothetical protein ACO22_01663 [Paracoccidioides brasiliensis]|uniref:Uncharacterized protein n=1 Tax=Paracoccidioides brasiliensis TaxID=121759 RepID=A0A1D2JKV3_PARBR|nr:hypothetical protein ACO22_01663 [Paracoccidioides brasiliensis]
MTSSRQSTVSRLLCPASKLEPCMEDECHRCEMTMEAEKTMSLSSLVDIIMGITPRKRLIWMDAYRDNPRHRYSVIEMTVESRGALEKITLEFAAVDDMADSFQNASYLTKYILESSDNIFPLMTSILARPFNWVSSFLISPTARTKMGLLSGDRPLVLWTLHESET